MIKKLIYIYTILPIMLLANNNLEISLEHNTSSKTPLEVILKVTNTSDQSIQITPANFAYDDGGIVSDILTILENGEKIPYIGPIVFIELTKKTLKSGESHQGYVNLAEYYQLKTGTHIYEIHYGNVDSNLSSPLEIEATIKPKKKIEASLAKSNTCSNSRRSILSGDRTNAKTYTLKAKNYLQNSPRNHALYQKWFGVATPGRYHTVYTNYSKIYSGFSQNVTYDCSSTHSVCSKATAFVWRNQPYRIYLCSSYWNYNSNYRASTLVHEMSHFNSTSGTVDGNGVYNIPGANPYRSKQGAQNLARINPSLAIRNAYSYHNYALKLGTSGGGGGGNSNINYEFSSHNNAQGWTYRNLRQHGSGPMDGRWYFIARYNDPQIISPALNLNANVIKKVVVKMANDHNPAHYGRMQVFWKKNGEGYSEANSQTVSVTNHGGWTIYTLDMSNNPRWNGNIREIRIDPIDRGDGHWLAFDYIRFTQ